MPRNRRNEPQFELDGGMLIVGLLFGFAVGSVYMLLNAPRSGREAREQITDGISQSGENLRTTLDNVVPSDPVAESIAEGKAAARRRREELGLGDGS